MNTSANKIAVVGMACRFPGAHNVEEYWNNLILGKETLSHFSDEELSRFEPDFESLNKNPDYIKVRGIVNDVDKFDASFFGMTPKEAAVTDPQHRIWLETAWEALENAGCNPFDFPGAIGVFAGGTMSSYLHNNILSDPVRRRDFLKTGSTDTTQIMFGNDMAFVPTKTAYSFNLRGPAIYVQTACSTSLVAIVQACQSLYSYESDMCLAGGVSIYIPQ
jgi:acyl transferase domain-containing protein